MSSPADAPPLYRLILNLPADLGEAEALATAPALGEAALAFSAMRQDRDHRGEWLLIWLFDAPPDEDAVRAELGAADWTIEPVPQVNWLAHTYQQFQPFTVGPFFIYGSHYDGTPPQGALPLQIDAATAFGSGEHGTTAGCLLALARLKEQGFAPRRVLDMGCGSGILAIAAARLWPDMEIPVAAIDNDAEAVIVTARHAAMNGVASQVDASVGEGFAASEAEGPFTLVIANILAGPLLAMADDLVRATAPGGRIVLSGLLTEQAAEVAARYAALGCRLAESFVREPWAAQLWATRLRIVPATQA